MIDLQPETKASDAELAIIYHKEALDAIIRAIESHHYALTESVSSPVNITASRDRLVDHLIRLTTPVTTL
jgi:hypothetical protein